MFGTKNYKLTLVHLYPKLLNIYGDAGNILALKRRSEDYGIELEILGFNEGDELKTGDIYFIGGGQDTQQRAVSKELFKHREFFKSEAESGKVFLGICGGYQLLGHYYETQDGEKLDGIGVFDAYTQAGEKRFIGNVTAYSDFLKPETLVGFENHSGLTYLNNGTKPLATVKIGFGNNGKDNGEGARYKNAFGTYLHGSFLPKNPHFTDYMLQRAIKNRYKEEIVLEGLDDRLEYAAHNSVVNKKY